MDFYWRQASIQEFRSQDQICSTFLSQSSFFRGTNHSRTSCAFVSDQFQTSCTHCICLLDQCQWLHRGQRSRGQDWPEGRMRFQGSEGKQTKGKGRRREGGKEEKKRRRKKIGKSAKKKWSLGDVGSLLRNIQQGCQSP